MTQFFMAFFGLAAMGMAMSHNTRARSWAPIVGLLGQPAWAYFAYQTGGWGLGLLVAAYTALYIRAICINDRRRRP